MNNLKYIYTFVFISLAGWALFAYFTTTQIINTQEEHTYIINIAGKQRMLSQKTALIAKRYYESRDNKLKEHLQILYNSMATDHKYILQKFIISPETHALYYEDPVQLKKKVDNYLRAIEKFLTDNELHALQDIEHLSYELLPVLDKAVTIFETESIRQTQLLLEREVFILIGTLLTLFLEALFIVIPAINYANQHEDELNALVKKRTEELERLSVTDALTQLYNRRKTDETLAQEIERAHRYKNSFSVILLDIDKFKDVNDTYGHQTGDAVLIQISKLLSVNVRKIDTLGRWGGEEFFIINTETNPDKAVEFSEKIRSIIAAYNFDKVGKVTCSFGVTHYIHGDTQDTILARCDEALYTAKNSGRNCVREALI